MSSSNVVHAAPPGPPGPATFDYSRFKGNAVTTMVDTQNLELNANVVNACRVRAYGDPADPTAPGVSTPAIATQILYAPYFDASNTAQFNPVVLLGNTCTYLTQQLFVQRAVTIGQPFSWTPPTFSTIVPSQPRLSGTTFGQSYPLSGGQLRGYATLYVPQPPVSQKGLLLNLNGGTVAGNGIVYR